MATIKAMIVEKLRQQRRDTADDIVSGKIKQFLENVCLAFPDETPTGREFAKAMSGFRGEWHAKVIDSLVEKAMNERDDLGGEDFMNLRQSLVTAINNWR